MKKELLIRFGFKYGKGGAHLARTMMLDELQTLLSCCDSINIAKSDYFRAIEQDNCLGKRSGKTRSLTARHLADLYALDPAVTIFRALRYFWARDPDGHSLIALACAYARDPMLRSSAEFIRSLQEGQVVSRETLETYINDPAPDRFSPATLKSVAQNINSTWTKSGHVSGKVRKIRSKARPTPGAAAYALFLGFLTGGRGESLFHTEYAKLLDCSAERTMELAGEASRRGWIVFKRVGHVMEALFPALLTPQEMEWIREQN